MNNWVAVLLQAMLGNITPEIRNAVVEFIGKLEKQATETSNKWDDVLVGILKSIFQVP